MISSATFRSGAYSLRFEGTQKFVEKPVYAAPQDRILYIRTYIYIVTAPSSMTIINQGSNAPFTQGEAEIRLGSDRTLTLWQKNNSGIFAQKGSASAAIPLNEWHMVELKLDGPGNIAAARLDRVEFASSSSETVGSMGNTTYATRFGNYTDGPGGGDIYLDDMAINDDTGSFENSWPGEGEVIHLRPDAAGDNAQWTRTGTDSGANWSQVDEVTPNDGTDRVQEDTSGNIDDYNLDATPAGMDSDDIITAVQVGVRYRAVLGLFSSDFVLRIKASAGGTVEEGATIAVSTGNFRSHRTNEPFIPTLTLYDLPGASVTAWTKADLDAAQIGQRCTETSAAGTDVTTIWLTVDHKGIGRPWASPTPPLPLIRREVVAY